MGKNKCRSGHVGDRKKPATENLFRPGVGKVCSYFRNPRCHCVAEGICSSVRIGEPDRNFPGSDKDRYCKTAGKQ